jgi:hypothetical protein
MGLLTTSGKVISPTTALNHEFDHAVRFDKDPERRKADKKLIIKGYGNAEEKRVIEGSDQKTAKALGEIAHEETTRTDHDGTMFPTTGVTSSEIDVEYYYTEGKKP